MRSIITSGLISAEGAELEITSLELLATSLT